MSMIARVNVAAGSATVYPTGGGGGPDHRHLFSMPDGTLVGLTDSPDRLYRAGTMDDLPSAMTATPALELADVSLREGLWVFDWRFVVSRRPGGMASDDRVVTRVHVADNSTSASVENYDVPRTSTDSSTSVDDSIEAAVARPEQPPQVAETWTQGSDLHRRITQLSPGGRSTIIDDVPILSVELVYGGYVYFLGDDRQFAFQGPSGNPDLSAPNPSVIGAVPVMTREGPAGIAAVAYRSSGIIWLVLHGPGFVVEGRLKSTGRRFKTSRTPIW